MSNTATRVPIMARKPNADDASEKRETVPVKLARDLHRKAKMLAIDKERELYEYLDALLRPLIDAEYKKFFRDHKD